jgi:hypothetical protein
MLDSGMLRAAMRDVPAHVSQYAVCNLDSLTPNVVAVCGDWHANAEYAVAAVNRCAANSADVIIHVGDFGWTFQDNFMRRVNKALRRCGITLGFIAGNHDDHRFLAELETARPDSVIPLQSNILYIPRNYRWSWNGLSFLALGGAHSIDKPFRREGREWWPGETITWQEAEQAVTGGHADVMICHDCPAGIDIPGLLDPEKMPHAMQLELPPAQEHRELLRSVIDVVRPGTLYAGHYHCRHAGVIRHVDTTSTIVEILNSDAGPLKDNMHFIIMSA